MAPSYLKQAFAELYEEDGLLVMAQGLGLRPLLAKFLKLFSLERSDLVFCLNATKEEELLRDALMADGVPPNRLPVVITSEYTAKERASLYLKGGCFLVTGRILVVDFLNGTAPIEKVGGFLIHHAEKVTETSTEAFILRMFRQKNKSGFIKGFCEDPESLRSGYGKVEKVLRHLHVTKLYLWPRFHVEVADCLERSQPEVIELSQSLSESMKEIQQSILVALDACLQELKKGCSNLDLQGLSLEDGIFKAFDAQIRHQLDPEWHRLSGKTKQLVGDLKDLRKLLDYLLRYDALTFYSFLLTVQKTQIQRFRPSLWLSTPAAENLFQHAKNRVYVVRAKQKPPGESYHSTATPDHYELKTVLEENPKWKLLAQILGEITAEIEKDEKPPACVWGSRVLVLVRDERTEAQLQEYFQLGGEEMMRCRFLRFLSQTNAMNQRAAGKSHVSATSVPEPEKLDPIAALGLNRTRFTRLEHELLLQEEVKLRQAKGMPQAPARNPHPGKAKKRKRTAARNAGPEGEDTSDNDEYKAERIFEQSGMLDSVLPVDDATEFQGQLSFQPLGQSHIVIYTYSQASQRLNLLEEMQPSFVVLYDPEKEFVRMLELFQCSRKKQKLKVYFMVYEESVEEQRYMTSLKREKNAFESLIELKSHMVLPLNSLDAPTIPDSGYAISLDTRTTGRRKSQRKGDDKIVVDVREFRSTLPSLLHQKGLQLVPLTLLVGDFVLSPEICVERKSVADLYGSFASGRLYNQVEAMLRYYKIPTLLIEFHEDKAFGLQSPSEITHDLQISNICSKIALLTLHFPQLRILWSRSPFATVDIFQLLKKNQPDVDVEKAVACGGDSMEEEDEAGINIAAQELLQRLPGITIFNFRAVMKEFNNIAELATANITRLTNVVGAANASKLHSFLTNQSYL